MDWKTSSEVPSLLILAINEQRQGHYIGRRFVEFRTGSQNRQSEETNLQHEEIVYRDGPRTRIEFPPGSEYSGQLIVETAEQRLHYIPSRNEILVLPPRREENYDRLVGIARQCAEKKNFISNGPGERIAGVSTDQLVVADSSNRIVQRIFIEPRTGIVMKRQVFSAVGAQIGYFQFSQINFSPGQMEGNLFRIDRAGARMVTPSDTLRELAAKEGFEPIFFPTSSGYRLEESRVQTVQGERILVENFGSRKGRLTVFELNSPISPDRMQKMAKGAFQVYSFQRNNRYVVLLGPRTEGELTQLAQSLSSGTP